MNLSETERQILTRRIIEQTLKNRLNISELSDEDDGWDFSVLLTYDSFFMKCR